MTDDNDDDDDEWRTFFLWDPDDAVSTPPNRRAQKMGTCHHCASCHRTDALIHGDVVAIRRLLGVRPQVYPIERRPHMRELSEDAVAVLALISVTQRALKLCPLSFRNLTPQRPTAFDHARRPLPIVSANVMHVG